jgi:hypothetical protein
MFKINYYKIFFYNFAPTFSKIQMFDTYEREPIN